MKVKVGVLVANSMPSLWWSPMHVDLCRSCDMLWEAVNEGGWLPCPFSQNTIKKNSGWWPRLERFCCQRQVQNLGSLSFPFINSQQDYNREGSSPRLEVGVDASTNNIDKNPVQQEVMEFITLQDCTGIFLSRFGSLQRQQGGIYLSKSKNW